MLVIAFGLEEGTKGARQQVELRVVELDHIVTQMVRQLQVSTQPPGASDFPFGVPLARSPGRFIEVKLGLKERWFPVVESDRVPRLQELPRGREGHPARRQFREVDQEESLVLREVPVPLADLVDRLVHRCQR